jgi:hypothetical protein
MAALNPDELAELRRVISNGVVNVAYNKAQINAAVQAIEDYFETHRVELSAAIDAASTPFVFTNPQKKQLVRYWLDQKARREGV